MYSTMLPTISLSSFLVRTTMTISFACTLPSDHPTSSLWSNSGSSPENASSPECSQSAIFHLLDTAWMSEVLYTAGTRSIRLSARSSSSLAPTIESRNAFSPSTSEERRSAASQYPSDWTVTAAEPSMNPSAPSDVIPPGTWMHRQPSSAALSRRTPPDDMQKILHPRALSSLYISTVSGVSPEYDMTMQSVPSPMQPGTRSSPIDIILTPHSSSAMSDSTSPGIMESPIPNTATRPIPSVSGSSVLSAASICSGVDLACSIADMGPPAHPISITRLSCFISEPTFHVPDVIGMTRDRLAYAVDDLLRVDV